MLIHRQSQTETVCMLPVPAFGGMGVGGWKEGPDWGVLIKSSAALPTTLQTCWREQADGVVLSWYHYCHHYHYYHSYSH